MVKPLSNNTDDEERGTFLLCRRGDSSILRWQVSDSLPTRLMDIQ